MPCAARLQERDIAEDAAAVALAKALVPYPEQAGLRLSAAFTGRVNLIATGAGVVSQTVKKLIALNSIDSMISLIEPLMIIVMGAIVVVVVIAMLVPMLSIMSQMRS